MTSPQMGLTFQTAGKIQFGRGAAAGAADAIAAIGRAAFLVHGATAARADWLKDALIAAGCRVTTFACPNEPDIAGVEAGVAAARAAGAEVVVSLGGGAPIDLGKAVAALVPATRPMLDHLEVVGQGLPLDHAPLPFVALPTTAGTGAEVTKNAVINVPEARRKVSLRDDRMLPDLAIVDPALTDGAPRSVTLASGLDAVTQVIEPYICTKSNRLTDALCRDAIPLGLAALAKLMEAEVTQARDDLAWVSLCGGLALANAGLGAVHGLAGPIGGMSPAPHGAVCGVLLPYVLEANAAEAGPHAAARLADVRGWIAAVLGGTAQDAPATLARWSATHGLPRLGAMGLAREDLPAIAEAAGGSSSMKANPVPLSAAALLGVLERAL
ncbi:iron-containing alcohol dehydrogenase [Meridianimarinicoccus aquatilis]|nr:iron-containing alcohol dehydrogenase [Fluviibacterium aquatile]